jgi:hypothetical protein
MVNMLKMLKKSPYHNSLPCISIDLSGEIAREEYNLTNDNAVLEMNVSLHLLPLCWFCGAILNPNRYVRTCLPACTTAPHLEFPPSA